MENSPIRPTDDEARALARELTQGATFAALGVIDPATGAPHVTRISFALDASNQPITLVSTLAFHTGALQANPICSLLIGEPPNKGDPLAFPRLTLSARAEILPPEHKADLRGPFLKAHPKAQLYIDFSDFHFVRFDLTGAALNAGFGKAYELTKDDLK
jgi:putative heme iron utilization protein